LAAAGGRKTQNAQNSVFQVQKNFFKVSYSARMSDIDHNDQIEQIATDKNFVILYYDQSRAKLPMIIMVEDMLFEFTFDRVAS
jgi:hypothetical protein